MPKIEPFFSVSDWGDALTAGGTLKIVHSLHYVDYKASPHLAPLVEQTAQELQEKLKASTATEEAIFKKIKASVKEWEAQASQTMLLKMALEYVRTPEVSHTSNEWKQTEPGKWEISNRVYQMRYHFDPVPQSKAVRVSWKIMYNTPLQPGNSQYSNSWGDSRYIARQDNKTYDSMDAAQRYIQGRFNLYAHLFTELSPPIPNDCKRMFMVNGRLLPGYTLAPPAQTREQTVSNLLDCLEEEDTAPLLKAVVPPRPQRPAAKKSDPKKSGPVR